MNIKYILLILFIYTSSLFCMYDFNLHNTFASSDFTDNDVIDIRDIVFEDYSMNLNLLGFPTLSSFLMVEKKLPILRLVLELYQFIGYDKNVTTYVDYLNFFRTLKTIEYFFIEDNKNISASFSYSSVMNVNYKSMLRDLSGSYSDLYLDTNILLYISFYIR